MPLINRIRIFDGHWHARDEEQSAKDTIARSLAVAEASGIVGIAAMPNTQKTLTTPERCREYLAIADEVDSNVEFYVHIGATANSEQLKRAVEFVREEERVLGIKVFLGKSTGSLSIVEEEGQLLFWRTISEEGYEGVVIGHCEDEKKMDDSLYVAADPITHSTLCRPEKAETNSVEKNLRMAEEAGFKGIFHIAHVSTVTVADKVPNYDGSVRLSCELSPNHAFLSNLYLNGKEGAQAKCNPALRAPTTQQALLARLIQGLIPMMQSDHASHTIEDKQGDNPASGIACGAYWANHVNHLADLRMDTKMIDQAVFVNPVQLYGLDHLLEAEPRAIQWDKLRALQKSYAPNPFNRFYGLE